MQPGNAWSKRDCRLFGELMPLPHCRFLRPIGAGEMLADTIPDQDGRFSEAPDQVALPGHDGDKAESLLQSSKRAGAKVLAELTREALERAGTDLLHAKTLFNREELRQLAKQFERTAATADLLGRSRIRIRLENAEKYGEDDLTDFSRFEESKLSPLMPTEALRHFKALVPKLGIDPEHWGPLMERHAFTMAQSTSKALLKRCQKLIADAMALGLPINEGGKHLDAILDKAGVSPNNPYYAAATFRTNCMEAYRAGAQREFSDPDVAKWFPVWKYMGIDDGRERHGPLPKYPDHRRWFNKYFDRSVLFTDVRGRDARDAVCCRCNQVPVYVARWKRLQAAGARLTPWPIAA
jgi:hypothetical protein